MLLLHPLCCLGQGSSPFSSTRVKNTRSTPASSSYSGWIDSLTLCTYCTHALCTYCTHIMHCVLIVQCTHIMLCVLIHTHVLCVFILHRCVKITNTLSCFACSVEGKHTSKPTTNKFTKGSVVFLKCRNDNNLC